MLLHQPWEGHEPSAECMSNSMKNKNDRLFPSKRFLTLGTHRHPKFLPSLLFQSSFQVLLLHLLAACGDSRLGLRSAVLPFTVREYSHGNTVKVQREKVMWVYYAGD